MFIFGILYLALKSTPDRQISVSCGEMENVVAGVVSRGCIVYVPFRQKTSTILEEVFLSF